MKKHLAIVAIAMMASGFTNPASAVNKTNPIKSFGFVQEMAGVINKGEIRADIYNTTSYPWHLRIGALGGEILIDPSTGNTATGLGYKHSISPNLALYGKLFLDSGAGGQTNKTLGVSYTGQRGMLVYSGNVHFTDANGGNTSTLLLNGAAFYRFIVKSLPGRVQVGGELSYQMDPSPSETNLFVGFRWEPRTNLLIDLGLATSIGGTDAIQTPAFVRLNLGF